MQETLMGAHGKGTRNRNGQLLANFLSEHQYYATNTTFKHSMRHRSTWYGHISNKHIYNQIDYIMVPLWLLRKSSNVLTNSRSYDNTNFPSDHKIIIAELVLRNIHRVKTPRRLPPTRPFNHAKLTIDLSAREHFQQHLATQLIEIPPTNSPNEDHIQITQILKRTTEEILPQSAPPLKSHLRFTDDSLLTKWSLEKKKLVNKLRHHPNRPKRTLYKKRCLNLTIDTYRTRNSNIKPRL